MTNLLRPEEAVSAAMLEGRRAQQVVLEVSPAQLTATRAENAVQVKKAANAGDETVTRRTHRHVLVGTRLAISHARAKAARGAVERGEAQIDLAPAFGSAA